MSWAYEGSRIQTLILKCCSQVRAMEEQTAATQ